MIASKVMSDPAKSIFGPLKSHREVGTCLSRYFTLRLDSRKTSKYRLPPERFSISSARETTTSQILQARISTFLNRTLNISRSLRLAESITSVAPFSGWPVAHAVSAVKSAKVSPTNHWRNALIRLHEALVESQCFREGDLRPPATNLPSARVVLPI